MLYAVYLIYQTYIHWNYPPPSNSDHQDYYIFNRESQPKPSFVTVTGWGVDRIYTYPTHDHKLFTSESFSRLYRGADTDELRQQLARLPGKAVPRMERAVARIIAATNPNKRRLLPGLGSFRGFFWEGGVLITYHGRCLLSIEEKQIIQTCRT